MKNIKDTLSVKLITILALGLMAFVNISQDEKPVLYIIGDSTVQNNDGNGKNAYWGWGTLLKPYLDSTRISLQNHAKSGTSTRTFILDGRWNKILKTLKKGDFVIMQFGHNDHAGVDDTSKQKGSLLGISDSTKEIISIRTHQKEIVHTYGWYMQKFITEAKAKGAIPIVCSLVPRNRWEKNGEVVKEAEYPEWAETEAKINGAYYINLNRIIAGHWKELGQSEVKKFFPGDGTHTNIDGARLNASCVVEGLMQIKDCPLNLYLK
ncbi:rhamnogalacturonan acetylesterase [Mucilaginibacter sp. HMF5004]|uniref:rhamnogalacturonan acetylesterase n=1 Tax=Mucilaginibacter rivuli TaxID=2857527 RepID=UPI001C602026|nr:rhamnogalacturonan acetylesterase [Mucilaginibacter rivuli]MBW4890251.1 rhamnogalacturonan acetylesterase [Mucilaginibacter rivuli]